MDEKDFYLVEEIVNKIDKVICDELRLQCISVCSQIVDMICNSANRLQSDIDLIDSLDNENHILKLKLQKIEIEKELDELC